METTSTKKMRVRKVKVETKPVETTPVQTQTEEKAKEEDKRVESIPIKLEKNETKETAVKKEKKKKRVVDESKMTYLKAFSIWKQKNNYSGLSPKKNSKEYDEIMTILKEG